MKLGSRKRGARRELDLRVCLVWRQSFYIFCCKSKKKYTLNYSETLRRKTLFVSSPAGVKLPHSHGMAADENKKEFLRAAEMLRVV